MRIRWIIGKRWGATIGGYIYKRKPGPEFDIRGSGPVIYRFIKSSQELSGISTALSR